LQHHERDPQQQGGGQGGEGEGERGPEPALEQSARRIEQQQGDEHGPDREEHAEHDLGREQDAKAREQEQGRRHRQGERARSRSTEERRERGRRGLGVKRGVGGQSVEGALQAVEHALSVAGTDGADHDVGELLRTLEEEGVDHRLIGRPLRRQGEDGPELDHRQGEVADPQLRAAEQELVAEQGDEDRQQRREHDGERAGGLEQRAVAAADQRLHVAVYREQQAADQRVVRARRGTEAFHQIVLALPPRWGKVARRAG
jgi:hypothetical protein